MGCYNISGFYSHLPIQNGERVGAVICARVNEIARENILMEPFSTGIYPVLAPVYGTYDECGGLNAVDESYSAELFKEVTGHSVIDFMNKGYRNAGVTVNTPDNDNQFDDIPGYQEIIKNMIPLWQDPSEFDMLKQYTDPAIAQQYEQCKKWEADNFDSACNASFLVLFEHESVLKQLIKTGSDEYHFTFIGDEQSDFNSAYDKFAAANDGIDDKLGYQTHFMFHNMLYRNDVFKKVSEIVGKGNFIETDMWLSMYVKVIDLIPRNLMFMRIYKNAKHIDYAKLKDDFLSMLSLHSGLYQMHGSYTECMYAGQEIEKSNFVRMHEVFDGIIKNLYDDEE